jgi:hypothetical protein
MKFLIIATLISFVSSFTAAVGRADQPVATHTFAFGGDHGEQFQLDGKPFQIRDGEMHPSRIPHEYWRHRIQMAKAMGLNTISIYVFWNDHEREEGKFDFTSGNRDIAKFLKIAQDEGMWVLLRPGPYVCGEWDFGGIPTYLLRYGDLQIRTLSDPHYTRAAERYIHALAPIVRPFLAANGGPILMVQIENEYGSYERRDRKYPAWVRNLWIQDGIPGPFYTADVPTADYLRDAVLPGVAVGLNHAEKEADWDLARKMNPGVPVFSAETYPGWLKHWSGDDWAPTDVGRVLEFFMDTNKSFSLYMFHGGTNFGFTAGANDEGPAKFLADLTSYDYGAPLTEQGRPTPAYFTYRKLLASYLPPNEKLPDVPAPIPTMSIPEIKMERWTTIWDHLPPSFERSGAPVTFESLSQNQGLVLYRKTPYLKSKGTLHFDRLNDYGLVLINGKYIGSLDRSKGEHDIEIPDTGDAETTLDVLVEGMGHINYDISMEQDRKGLSKKVTLDRVPLTNWHMFQFPLDESWITSLQKTDAPTDRPGGIFRGRFTLDTVADTFLDLSRYQKGFVWINGHNLGRFWKIGPQQRLYCPAPWLKKGENELIVLDLHEIEAKPIVGTESPR